MPPRRRRALGAVAAATAMTVGGVFWWIPRDAHPTVPTSTPTPTPSATATPTRTARPPTWPATIVNAPRGVHGYPGPFTDPAHYKPAASLFEGDSLRIVCQERNGRVIKDSTTAVQSTLWYRLDTDPPGTDIWVTSLYAEVTPAQAGRPPPSIPNCVY